MYSLCVGEIGIGVNEFWCMSYKDVILAIKGYNDRDIKGWEKTREISYQIYLGIPKKEPNLTRTKFMPLSSDNIRDDKISRDEMIEARAFFVNKERARKV